MNRFLYNDDVEANLTALPKSGPHIHMQSDGEHTYREITTEPNGTDSPDLGGVAGEESPNEQ